MKKIKYLTFSILLFLVEIICVNAESGTICNIGTTDGLLYSNDWNFTVVDPTVDPTTAPNIPGINNKKRIYIFSELVNKK